MKTKKERLREAMRIGDRFYYPRLVKNNQGGLMEETVIVPVEVVGIYANMVQVEYVNRPNFTVKTITYDNMIDSKYHYMLKGNQRIQEIAKAPEIPA